MAVIDKISLFNGQAWSDPYYIGAEAENVRYNNTSNVKTALDNINLVTNVINASAIPSGKNYLTYVNNDGKIAPSNVHKDTVVQKNSAGIIVAPITSATIESILTKSVTVNSTAGSATLHLENNNLYPATQTTDYENDDIIGNTSLQLEDNSGKSFAYISGIDTSKSGKNNPHLILGSTYNYNNTALDNNLQMYFSTGTGDPFIRMSYPQAWRNALGYATAGNYISLVSKSTSFTTATDTTYLDSNSEPITVDLSGGIWLVFMAAAFTSNKNGYRTLFLSNAKNSGAVHTILTKTNSNATDGAQSVCSKTTILQIGKNRSPLYVNAYQNSGATLSSTLHFRAIKIQDYDDASDF